MKLLGLVLCISCVSSFYIDNHAFSKEKIVGGSTEVIANLAYQAALEYRKVMICGAAIIAQQWLLSAAQCLAELENPYETVKVRAGTSHKEKGGNLYKVINIIFHENYDEDRIDDDIVLVKAPMDLNDHQKIIPMHKTSENPKPNTYMTISGFGKESEFDEDTSDELKSAGVYVEPYSLCKAFTWSSESVFCATSYPNDTCGGDYGGPAVINGKLVGIIVAGDYCAFLYSPGIYTKVGRYFDWIVKNTGLSFDYELQSNLV